MKAIYNNILLFLGVIASCSPLCAQTDTASAVKVRFRLMSWDSIISDLNYAQDKKIVAVSLQPNSRSPFYAYQGSETDPLLFFRELKGPDGKPLAEVAASVPLDSFKERTLLLFFKSPTSPKQYRVQPIDDTDAAIPPGCYHFLNLTSVPLRIVCGAARADVPAGQEQTVRGNPADGGEITGMQVDAMTPSGIRHAYSDRLPFGKTTRTLVFVWQVPETGAFEVKRLQEDVAAIPKPSPSPRS